MFELNKIKLEKLLKSATYGKAFLEINSIDPNILKNFCK